MVGILAGYNTKVGAADQWMVATKNHDPFTGTAKAVCCSLHNTIWRLEWMDYLSGFAWPSFAHSTWATVPVTSHDTHCSTAG